MTLRAASTRARTVAALIAVLSGTGSAQMPPRGNQPDIPLETDERQQVLVSLGQTLRENYAFADLGERLARSLQARQARKAYEQITSAKAFAARITSQLQEIAHDPHLRLMFSAAQLSQMSGPQPGGPPQPREDLQRTTNFGFERIEHLIGNARNERDVSELKRALTGLEASPAAAPSP
jgi:hypothetical protein